MEPEGQTGEAQRTDRLAFGGFILDRRERTLRKGDAAIDLGSRYFDALLLLADNCGRLVSKDRFMDEVWRGVPVTDEALTQCIRSLRRALGDDASAPRFIETVPKHGYRFVAEVDGAQGECGEGNPAAAVNSDWVRAGRLAGGTTLGGVLAGLAGGVFYGGVAGAEAQAAGAASASVFLVMLALTTAIGTLGAAGVGTGMAIARALRGIEPLTLALGGAIGGLVIGALGKLLSLDGFALLIGSSPGNITGMSEGLAIGAATGAVAWWVLTAERSRGASAGVGACAGTVIGATIALAGGRLMAGSLSLLHRQFPDTHLHVDGIGGMVGAGETPAAALVATTALEGGLFIACIAVLLHWLRPRIV